MSMYSFLVALLASHPHGHNLGLDDFVGPLMLEPNEPLDAIVHDAGSWASSRVEFPIVRLADFKSAPEPHEEMMNRLGAVLEGVATFLDRRSPEVFERFRNQGLAVSLFIDVWMDQDQMEFLLPPSVLRAAGRVGIGIHIISNDF
jgi:hypothetical protein